MKPLSFSISICVSLYIFFYTDLAAQSKKTFLVDYSQPKGDIQPTMWGVFFEDINLGADGGIYAEMIKNRSFEFQKPLMGWTIRQKKFVEGRVLVISRKGLNVANPRFIRVTADQVAKGDLGLTNEGFRGMGIKKDLRYDFSFLYRQASAGVKIHVELTGDNNMILGATIVEPSKSGVDWQRASGSFTSNGSAMKGKLNIWFEGEGVIDLDMISLFPADTWKNRAGGMRADMIQLLADMKPGFIRFPGGCIVEGFDLSTRYQWKKTIGPVEERQLIINRWNQEFAHRPAPDYFQTFGLGFYEYFQLAEDIGAEPLPILNCGMACQFNSAEVAALDELDPYVQDVLDLIEFANGDSNTNWGKRRFAMGHPAPFNLKMLGIGNENWGPQYVERLKIFTKAIKQKHPGIKLVYSSGTDPNGERYEYLDKELRNLKVDIIDEHYYRKPDWFLANVKRYDSFPRNGPKIFSGEYAAQSDRTVSPDNKNNWLTALSEAAFMTGLERNADIVSMASYAPLFAHVDGWQWTPDLIWVNNLEAYGTPNYFVQKLYSLNKGTRVIPITMNNQAVAGQDSLYASACIDDKTNELIVKIVNASAKNEELIIDFKGMKKFSPQGTKTVLQAEPSQVNGFGDSLKIVPKESPLPVKTSRLSITPGSYSFTVLKLKVMK